MKKTLKKELRRATKELKALPNHKEYDSLSVSIHFVPETKSDLKLVMDSVAIKNTNVEELDEDNITLLGTRKVLSTQVCEDLSKILAFIYYCSRHYAKQMVVCLPKELIHFHGLEEKEKLTAEDLTLIIRYSFSMDDFSFWNDKIGFQIKGKKV